MKRFGSSGARGPVETDLTPETVLTIAQTAVNTWNTNAIAIGRDVRVTGRSLEAAAIAGATAAGAEVDCLGVVPTPAVQAYARRHGIHAIVITASHNPPPDNGVKLIERDGGELSVPAYEEIETRLSAASDQLAEWNEFGASRTVEGINRDYVDELVGALDQARISTANLRIVIDSGNGTTGWTSATMCRRLGCEVHTINAQPDGHFPGRQSEPVPSVLDELSAMVTASDADLGVAHDGDGDRAVFVDERGKVVDGGAVLSALAAELLHPGDAIVAAVTAPKSLSAVASAMGGQLELTPVGAANVLTAVRTLQEANQTVAIAGEQNGGIIVPTYSLARDGAYALGLMLELVAKRPLSELVAPYTEREFRRHDIKFDVVSEREQAIKTVEGWAKEQPGDLSRIDGIRLDLDDRWVLARASGTEPLIRIYAEAPTAEAAIDLIEEVADRIEAQHEA